MNSCCRAEKDSASKKPTQMPWRPCRTARDAAGARPCLRIQAAIWKFRWQTPGVGRGDNSSALPQTIGVEALSFCPGRCCSARASAQSSEFGTKQTGVSSVLTSAFWTGADVRTPAVRQHSESVRFQTQNLQPSMICEACRGQQTFPPCPECGGCGIAHCCDGLVACPTVNGSPVAPAQVPDKASRASRHLNGRDEYDSGMT
jgi:hypothetical protein